MGFFENYTNTINQLQSYGLLVSDLQVDTTRPVRCAVDTNLCPVDPAKRRTAGWYHLASFVVNGKYYIVGAYGFWKGADNNQQKIEWDKTIEITPEQKKAQAERYKQMKKQAEQARAEEVAAASRKAQWIWSKYSPAGESDYLQRKQVGAHGVRFGPHNTVAVPIADANGKLFGLQLIRSDAAIAGTKKIQKKFEPKGLAISGRFHLIGSPREVVLIAEGYATAATIHETTSLPIAVAFNANNITPTAKALNQAYPDALILICADDDYLTDGNPGVAQAERAVNTVGGRMVKPSFTIDGHDIRNGEKLTDFNDLTCHPQGGPHLVRAQIETALKDVSISTAPAAPAAGASQKGEGESYRARSVMTLDEIAERYILVEDGTGKTVFDTWSRNFSLSSMIDRQLPVKCTWNDLKAHPVWNSRALKKEQVAFDPTGKDKKILENRWTGWPIQNPKHSNPEKQCENALNLLFYLCKDEDESGQLYLWVLKWLAYPIQNPGAKMDSCLVFKGAQGTGKGFLFIQIFGAMYGEFFASLTQSALEDKFNSDWTDRKLFIVADEVVASSDKYRYKNQLKTLISEPVIRVNPKNMAAYQERNHFNLVFLSNEAVPVILENDDRRHCVIKTPAAMPQDFYYQLQDEVDAGGVEALYQYLLELDLGDFNTRTKPPMTTSKEDLIDLGLDSHQRFIKYWLNGDTDFPVGPVSYDNLYKAYSKWILEEGEHYKHAKKDLKPVLEQKGLKLKIADLYDSYHYNETTKKSTRIFEPNEIHFARLAKQGKSFIERKADQTLAQWRTDGNMAFNKIFEENY